jgi:hypothetical protein
MPGLGSVIGDLAVDVAEVLDAWPAAKRPALIRPRWSRRTRATTRPARS